MQVSPSSGASAVGVVPAFALVSLLVSSAGSPVQAVELSTSTDEPRLFLEKSEVEPAVQPLETITVVGASGKNVTVSDSAGRVYFQGKGRARTTFLAGGSLGRHTVTVSGAKTKTTALNFNLEAQTKISDDGTYSQVFNVLQKTLGIDPATGAFAGGFGSREFRGRRYRLFVPWILDHAHTARAMQYFSPDTGDFVDLQRLVQRPDGMVWSFVRGDSPGYYATAYSPAGYALRTDGALFARQPIENHPEYLFVDTMHMAWKGSGDDNWMKTNLDAAMRALDYSVTDRSRWSSKYQLLKRGYTVDTWDFHIDDGHIADFPLANAQMIDPDRTKFGIFFGDNTGYAQSCEYLAEMLRHAGRPAEADKYATRAREIRGRLDKLSWNGRFFTHWVPEDPSVKRDLGVDEKSQVALSNAYSLNRDITHAQAAAIIRTYQNFKANLPVGSPGEWYAIYPPFERGLGDKWQYMNGGVHGHVAGELSRGAFEHGFEEYGADILRRIGDLGRQHEDRVRFAYTGSIPPAPAPQVFTPLDLAPQANMDIRHKSVAGTRPWMLGAPDNGLEGFPVGRRDFAIGSRALPLNVPFQVADPVRNNGRVAVAVSSREGFARTAEIPVGQKAGSLYLLHTVGENSGTAGPAVGSLTFNYEDGTKHSIYINQGEHLTGWWFPELATDRSGIAWRGPNGRSLDVGVSWGTLDNPHPEKTIRSLAFGTSLNDAIYTVLGVTLADKPHYLPISPLSTGGPDRWSGATCMAALIQGLAGVADEGVAFRKPRLSPRWSATDTPSATVVTRYPASQGYVAYRYKHDNKAHMLEMISTGSADNGTLRVLLPLGVTKVAEATLDDKRVTSRTERIEDSTYAILRTPLRKPATVRIRYDAKN